jgi:hypothetical protein
MNSSRFAAENTENRIPYTYTESNQSSLRSLPPDPINTQSLVGWGLVGLGFSCLIFLICLVKVRGNTRKKVVYPSKDLQEIPCRTCRYFTGDPYLKCAVNPSVVLTKEALNCLDYTVAGSAEKKS